MCGTCANEIAYKAVFMNHQKKLRGSRSFNEEELQSCMKNSPPGLFYFFKKKSNKI